MREIELAVVGAGPAGVAAAVTAANLGVETVLFDEGPVDAAWLRRQIPYFFGDRAGSLSVDHQVVYRWNAREPLLRVAEAGVDVRTQHAVWGVFPQGELGVYDGKESSLWQARQIVVAAGGNDIGLAFPGWTLGGVLGGAGALRLFETFGYLEARRMVILGSGALALAVAQAAQERDVEVAALVEVEAEPLTPPEELAAVAGRGTEVLPGHTVLRAEGRGEVERVVLTAVDAAGIPVPGSERTLQADTLVLALGLTPNLELPFLARCDFGFDRAKGGAFPVRDATMRTSAPGLLVAGDAAGTPWFQPVGSAAAEAQGRAAAWSAAEALGRLTADDAERRRAALPKASPNGQRAPALDTGSFLTAWHRVADGLAPEELLLCRCEEVSKRAVINAHDLVLAGYPDEVKRVSRAAMGFCQGRLCRAVMAGTVANHAGRPLEESPLLAYRPPLRPLPVSALAMEELTDFDREHEPPEGTWIQWWFNNRSADESGLFRPRPERRGRFLTAEGLV